MRESTQEESIILSRVVMHGPFFRADSPEIPERNSKTYRKPAIGHQQRRFADETL
jgi:hypothetical protein